MPLYGMPKEGGIDIKMYLSHFNTSDDPIFIKIKNSKSRFEMMGHYTIIGYKSYDSTNMLNI